MVFSYYNQLSTAKQRIYQQSDAINSISLSPKADFEPLVRRVDEALGRGTLVGTESACQELVNALTAALRVRPVRVEVMASRPASSWGELHGLYRTAVDVRPASITVWMRTAERRQIVAFRTFLRTLVHELCHHLDYELFRLSDSLHTEGFYKRESSVIRRLLENAMP